MTNIASVDDFTKNAVENFVQTVVFVDDKIYSPPPSGTVNQEKVTTPRVRKLATKSAEIKISSGSVETMPPDEERLSFSPHDIQISFAKKQIVCSLHQPQRKHTVGIDSATYRLCACADIVIVDWDLYGDAGVKATELVENLVVQSLIDDPHQLRLILIYTSDINLFDISNKLYEQLSQKIPDNIEYKDADQGLAFHTLNARVVVLGKPGERPEQFKSFEETEQGLADRAIKEYCSLADGLLQGCILQGLAAIRKQSRKILSKFHSDLDSAFLTHRALGYPHEEALDHITPLLVAEIESVLEDSLAAPLINNSVISNWCANKWKPAQHTSSFVPRGRDVRVFAADFCIKGMEFANGYTSGGGSDLEKTVKSLSKSDPKWPSVDTPQFKTLTSFLSEATNGSDLRELSVVMSQRTFYGANRHLTLGTIIRETEGDKRYLLCLQPVCDSLRLKKESTFIFCLLEVTKGERANLAVNEGKDFVDLIYKPGINQNCTTLRFKPTKGFVTANNLVFNDVTSRGFQWITQLKPKHAQRTVEQFARELSRVGLTESEWLRLKAK